MQNTQFPAFIFSAGVLKRDILLTCMDTHGHTHTCMYTHIILCSFSRALWTIQAWVTGSLDRQEELTVSPAMACSPLPTAPAPRECKLVSILSPRVS